MFLSIDFGLDDILALPISGEDLSRLKHGIRVPLPDIVHAKVHDQQVVRCYVDQDFKGLGQVQNDHLVPLRILNI